MMESQYGSVSGVGMVFPLEENPVFDSVAGPVKFFGENEGEQVSTGRKHAILLCLAMMLPLWFTAVARGGEKPKPSIDRDQPIQIVSDRLDAYHEKKMVVFTGNVVATQGKRTIKSDRLTLYYREDKKTSTRSTKTEMEGVGNVERG